MIRTVVRHLGDSDTVVAFRERAIMGIHKADKLGVIRIAPEPCRMLPWHLALDLHTVSQLIKYDALEVGIVLHDQGNVVQGIFQHGGTRLILQLFLPGIVLVRDVEVRLRLLLLFLKDQHLDLFILAGKVRHRTERLLLVLITEQVDSDDIECAAQLQICRVLGVVAVHELAALLDLDTRLAARLLKAVTGTVRRKLVDVTEEFINSKVHREVGVIEHTDDAVLFQRVRLFLVADALCLALPGGCGQSRRVRPFGMRREDVIGIQPVSVRHEIQVFSVRRRTRPVHHLVRKIGAFVKHVDAQFLRHIS
ncbi:hypothetical protein BW28_06015 [Clostridioides difficile]|nr:hypothetical protein BW28_06015 [Clostridioides difficile]